MLKNAMRWWCRIETAWLFLIVAGIVGLGFIIVTPPFKGWDEREHFFRAYQVADFNIRSEAVTAPNVTDTPETVGFGYGGNLPSNLVEHARLLHLNENQEGAYDYGLIARLNDQPISYSDTTPVRFDNTSIYSPAGYVPQSFGIEIAKLMDLGVGGMLYAARLAGLVAWLVLMYFAIKLVPAGKKIFMVIALNPVSVFLAATLSPDALATGLIALTVALALRFAGYAKRLSWPMVLLLFVLILWTVMIKNIYLPLGFIVLMLPGKVMAHWLKAVIITLPIALALLWNVSILHMTQTIPNYFGIQETISATEQVHTALGNPLKFVAILLWNIFGTNSILINSTYVDIFDRNPVPDWVVLVWLMALGVTLFSNHKILAFGVGQARRVGWVACGLFIIITGLIVASMYAGWSPVGDKDIMGVQGRYFIPISFLLVVPLLLGRKYLLEIPLKVQTALLYLVLPFALLVTVSGVFVRYTVGV